MSIQTPTQDCKMTQAEFDAILAALMKKQEQARAEAKEKANQIKKPEKPSCLL